MALVRLVRRFHELNAQLNEKYALLESKQEEEQELGEACFTSRKVYISLKSQAPALMSGAPSQSVRDNLAYMAGACEQLQADISQLETEVNWLKAAYPQAYIQFLKQALLSEGDFLEHSFPFFKTLYQRLQQNLSDTHPRDLQFLGKDLIKIHSAIVGDPILLDQMFSLEKYGFSLMLNVSLTDELKKKAEHENKPLIIMTRDQLTTYAPRNNNKQPWRKREFNCASLGGKGQHNEERNDELVDKVSEIIKFEDEFSLECLLKDAYLYFGDLKKIGGMVDEMILTIRKLHIDRLNKLKQAIEKILTAIEQEKMRLQETKPDDHRYSVLTQIQVDLTKTQQQVKVALCDPLNTNLPHFKMLACELIFKLRTYLEQPQLDKYSLVSKAIRSALNSVVEFMNQYFGTRIGLFSLSGRTKDLVKQKLLETGNLLNSPGFMMD